MSFSDGYQHFFGKDVISIRYILVAKSTVVKHHFKIHSLVLGLRASWVITTPLPPIIIFGVIAGRHLNHDRQIYDLCGGHIGVFCLDDPGAFRIRC